MPEDDVLDQPKPVKEQFSREYVHELREENKASRVARLEAEGKVKAAEELAAKHLTDAEAKTKAIESSANDRVLRAELRALAREAGILDLDDLKLMDVSGLKVDADGNVTGADALIAAFKEAKPYKFKEVSSTSSTTPTPKADTGKPKRIEDMSPAEIKAEYKKRGISYNG